MDPNVPIVAMTANNDSNDMKRCLALGMNGYIAKPFNLDELRAVVNGGNLAAVRQDGGQTS